MKKVLQKILKNAHAPYSNVLVAAIVKTKNGHIYHGVNIENSAYPSSMCAERAAIFSAISDGVKKDQITDLYLTSSLDTILYPCGACRQVMAEFFSPTTKIHIFSQSRDVVTNIEKLQPHSVTKKSFGWK